MQTVFEQNLRKEHQRKVNECIETLYQGVENSFNNIDAKLDELLNDELNQFNIIESQFQQEFPKVNFNKLFKQQDDNFSKQICQEMIFLIKNNIQNQIQKKDHQCQKLIKEIQEKLEHQIQVKDSQIQQNSNLLTIQQSSTIISNLKPFTYQIIKQNSIKQDQLCYAIAINKDCSILIAGWQNQIKVFEFMPIEIEWPQRQYLINDNQIKFWQNQNGWLCSQTINDHTQIINGLSFNEQQNRLISCGDDKFILVIEQNEQNKQWIVIQKITVEQYGFRLCFIDNDTFTFQPFCKEYIEVFEMNNNNKQYTKTKEIPVKSGSDNGLFPQQYIRSKCMLLNKNSSIVSLIRRKKNGEFITEESINFGTSAIYGNMSDDGQYLITWDNKSKEIQVRQYQEN